MAQTPNTTLAFIIGIRLIIYRKMRVPPCYALSIQVYPKGGTDDQVTSFHQPTKKEHIFLRGNRMIVVDSPALLMVITPLGVVLVLRRTIVHPRNKVIGTKFPQLAILSSILKCIITLQHLLQVYLTL